MQGISGRTGTGDATTAKGAKKKKKKSRKPEIQTLDSIRYLSIVRRIQSITVTAIARLEC
jgi:hypothetical protein